MTSRAALLREIETAEWQLSELKSRWQRVLQESPSLSETVKVLLCRVERDRVAISLEDVEQVVPLCEVAPLPEAPAWLYGLLNLRGSLLPVVDLATRFYGIERVASLTEKIVVCGVLGRRVGLVVQDVQAVVDLNLSELEPACAEVPQAPYVLAATERGGHTVFLLNLAALVTTDMFI